MSKYDLRNSQIGAVGDGAVAKNIVFNIGKAKIHDVDVDLDALAVELSDLKNNIESKDNKSEEEDKLLLDVTEIQELLYKKDLNSMSIKIKKCASEFFLKTASGIGVGLLANLISTVLGI